MYADDNGIYPLAWINSQTRWMDLIKPYIGKPSTNQTTRRLSLSRRFEANSRDLGYEHLSELRHERLSTSPAALLVFGMASIKAVSAIRRAPSFIADCTPGDYWCGSGSSFTNPVLYVDYRHPKNGFVAAYCDGHVEYKTITAKNEWDASK